MMKNILRAAMLAVFMLCSGAAWAEMVNINKADAAALMENLPGIGEKKADAIIKYRKENGNFKSIDGLLEVPGIGEATFKNLKSEVSVSKGATKATGKKPITSVKQTGGTKQASDTDKSAKKASKPAKSDKDKAAKKDSKSTDKKDTKSDDKAKTDKTAKKDSKSDDKAKTDKSTKKDSKSADKKADKKSSSKDKSKSDSKSKTKKADGKKKPKTKATPAPKKKKSSTKKKKADKKKPAKKQ